MALTVEYPALNVEILRQAAEAVVYATTSRKAKLLAKIIVADIDLILPDRPSTIQAGDHIRIRRSLLDSIHNRAQVIRNATGCWSGGRDAFAIFIHTDPNVLNEMRHYGIETKA